ncbi:DUF2683 family protein [Candidatus Woesearchaeota archaeon]|jgi:hypothetical protein|nr:DUF2683 family protein [Candidatus Woesearchaeota archaeon]MBT6518341.1 DUF2683 family protein [Candidatus Woesearchaeota archaeon]MBT7366638.1 DUF2683 family protein [Candidatus Woesearchaeota archaeon]
MSQINFRAQIDEYTNRVLGVIKEKYGLKDKAQALNKFANMFGEDFVEREVKEEFITEVLETIKDHKKKHSKRRTSLKELDKLTGL